VSSTFADTVTVRLAAPVLWGDAQDTVWVIINNGPGFYYVHVNSEDTNGLLDTLRTPYKRMPVMWYWDDMAGWKDSTTTDSVRHQFIALQVNRATPWVVQAKDDDGLIRGNVTGNPFIVFADSAPPAPAVTFSIGAGGGIINWRGKDVKDGNQTKYEILLKKGTTDPVEPTDIISQYIAGSSYAAATVGGFDFSYSFITQGTGEYHCQVIAKDARGTISKSTVVIFAY
jgi:type II secretory pathway pseudopilin PulG